MKRLLILVLFTIHYSLFTLPAQNPIINSQFTADPTARVFGGRLYLFPSHDIISPVEPERKWFCMADYHVFSTDNLTDWTDHGVILSQEQVPWGNPKGYAMWAPECIQVENGKWKMENGETNNKKYYFYFPDAPKEGKGFGVGVAIADKPEGPYTPQPEPIEGLKGIDPCVLQASNGENVIFWGAGAIFQARLKPSLMELDGEPQRLDYLPQAGLQEGPFAFERNGKYYLTYPWVRYKKGEKQDASLRESQGKLSSAQINPTEALVYCMSDSPMGPWEYKGIIMKEHADGCWTNHHSIVQFKGQWYLFYHHNDYSPKFDKNRSVCVDSLFFNDDGTIQEVIPTLRGVGVTDCTSEIQMDRYSGIGGGATIAYNDTTDYFKGWKTILPPKGWVSYGNVDITEKDYNCWVSTPGFWGRNIIKDIKETNLTLNINKQPNGLYELVLTNNGGRPAEVDWISLSKRKPLVPATAGGLATGTYRNLFVEAGYSPEAVEAKLQEVFNDVFVNKKTRCYFEVGKDKAYISDIKNDDVRTEGMSYGMMIAVQFDRKDIFDRLWRWTKEYMLIKDGPLKGYFRWSCKQDGTANAQGPASDGELYFITSLIFASNRWGCPPPKTGESEGVRRPLNSGEINYLKEAQNILNTIQPREIDFRGKKNIVSLIDQKTDIISFVPGSPFTDPSYNIPAFYEVWARYADDGKATYWRRCAQKCREYLHKSIDPITGLNPDYNNFDGSTMVTSSPLRGLGGAFRYDSWRVPMNIALDYSWACEDQDWQQKYGETIQNFLYSKGIDTFVDQYNVDGTTPEKLMRAGNYPEKLRHSAGLVATSAAASIMCRHQKSYEFIDHLWNARYQPDQDGFFDAYYDGLLRLFAFMHLSGHYRVIEKTPQLEEYFEKAGTQEGRRTRQSQLRNSGTPDEEGFIRRWTLRDVISKPNRSNTVFTDSYINETFPEPIQYKKGDKTWHCLDSKLYHVKLYRFATCTGQQHYGVIFWVTTTMECDEDMEVRFGIGSNGASKWWVDKTVVAMLSGDRRMVRDDFVSQPVKLHKGRNIITGAIINGPGMSDFCFRVSPLTPQGGTLNTIRIY